MTERQRHLSEQVLSLIYRGHREEDPANAELDPAGDLQQPDSDHPILRCASIVPAARCRTRVYPVADLAQELFIRRVQRKLLDVDNEDQFAEQAGAAQLMSALIAG